MMLAIALTLAQAEAAPRAVPPATVESDVEAWAADARDYAARYGVPFADAFQRLQAQEASVAVTDRIAADFVDRLAGIHIEHRPNWHIVVLLAGDDPVPDRVETIAGLAVPIAFRNGAPATRAEILAAIEQHQADLRAALPSAPGMGVDALTGTLGVSIRTIDLDDGDPAATAARLSAIAGVPVTVRTWADSDKDHVPLESATSSPFVLSEVEARASRAALATRPSTSLRTNGDISTLQLPGDKDLAIEGGGRLIGTDPASGRRFVCTSGFVVTDGTRTALSTAAHCPEALDFADREGTLHPLTMVSAWGSRTQDVQLHLADVPLLPQFRADDLARPRIVTSWRNRASTRVGDFVCHRGERTGYSCAEVAFVDYAPPGDLCAGPCPPTWVAVRGPTCQSGDSGGPIFLGTIAFGLTKGGSYTGAGACKLYYYMSIDYLPTGWTVFHR